MFTYMNCPNCEAQPIGLPREQTGPTYRVECSCGICGPYDATKVLAVVAWNTLAAAQSERCNLWMDRARAYEKEFLVLKRARLTSIAAFLQIVELAAKARTTSDPVPMLDAMVDIAVSATADK